METETVASLVTKIDRALAEMPGRPIEGQMSLTNWIASLLDEPTAVPISVVAPGDVYPADMTVPPGVGGFVLPTHDRIYVSNESREAKKEDLIRLASIVVHEDAHIRHGRDERQAYEAERAYLRRHRYADRDGSTLRRLDNLIHSFPKR